MALLHEQLNKQLANWNVLYVKLHNYHWYVKGNAFFTLHAKFQELYEEAAQYIDDIAERILAVNGKPLAKMNDYLAAASVKEAAGNESAAEMVDQLIKDFTVIINETKEAMKTAQEAGDEVTSDMLLDIVSELEKHVWMLNAYNSK